MATKGAENILMISIIYYIILSHVCYNYFSILFIYILLIIFREI